MPESTKIKLRFALGAGYTHTLTSNAGALSADFIYACNDAYDPYHGVGGAQPRGFDELMALYRHFCVIGSKITVHYTYATGAATNNTMICYLYPNDGSAAPADAVAVMENSRVKTKFLTQQTPHVSITKRWSYKIYAKDWRDASELWGTSSASPVEQWNYHIGGYCPGADTETCKFTGYMTYIVVFHQSIEPAQS